MSIYEIIAQYLNANGHQWHWYGEYVDPTPEIVEKALDIAKETLYAEPDGASMEFGRLIIKKQNVDGEPLYDIYVHIGEIV